jgi:predicted amidophosphoribosyltransferase
MDLVPLYFRSLISIADVVGNNRCVVCGATGDVFCQSHFLFFQENTDFSSDKHWWFWYYSGKAREIILDIKKHKQFRVAYRLGQYMGLYLKNTEASQYFQHITYVPHHSKEFKQTMFSMPFLIAMGISDIMEKPIIHLFVKTKTHSQHILSADKRRNNLKNVYNINRKIPKVGGPVLIVDDIVTTGSTLKSLKNLAVGYGIKKLYTITLARTPKWSDVI